MFPLDLYQAQRQRHSLIGILAAAGCLACLAVGLAVEFSADLGIADPPQFVASQDPFGDAEVNPTYSSTYDDGLIVYGTQTHAPQDGAKQQQPAHYPVREQVRSNRAERRGWREETPFMERGPLRRCVSWFGTSAWRLLRGRGRFVRLLPADSLRIHGYDLALANA
jgi:hypothetical protein